jgi:hypothetical protein
LYTVMTRCFDNETEAKQNKIVYIRFGIFSRQRGPQNILFSRELSMGMQDYSIHSDMKGKKGKGGLPPPPPLPSPRSSRSFGIDIP